MSSMTLTTATGCAFGVGGAFGVRAFGVGGALGVGGGASSSLSELISEDETELLLLIGALILKGAGEGDAAAAAGST